MSAQRDSPIVNTRRHFVKEFFSTGSHGDEVRSVRYSTNASTQYDII